MSSKKPFKVLLSMHDGFDVMDFFGPLEMLSIAQRPAPDNNSKAFQIVATSPNLLAMSTPGVAVQNNITLEDACQNLADFDILIIPGGASHKILKAGTEAHPIPLIRAFAALPPRDSSDRIIMSVCTGALFLAAAGVLKGEAATTNINDLDRLRSMVAGEDTTVAGDEYRFVVSPSSDLKDEERKGYRVMTSRGPGAGLDLSLWLVQFCVGEESRKAVEGLVEYQGRLNEGLVF